MPHIWNTSQRGFLIPAEEMHAQSPVTRTSGRGKPVVRVFQIEDKDMRGAASDGSDLGPDDLGVMVTGRATYATPHPANRLFSRVLPMIDPDHLARSDTQPKRIATDILAFRGVGGGGESTYYRAPGGVPVGVMPGQGMPVGAVVAPRGQRAERYQITVQFSYPPYPVLTDVDAAAAGNELCRFVSVRNIPHVEYARVGPFILGWDSAAWVGPNNPGKDLPLGAGLGQPIPYGYVEVTWKDVPLAGYNPDLATYIGFANDSDITFPFPPGAVFAGVEFFKENLCYFGATLDIDVFHDGTPKCDISARFANRTNWNKAMWPGDGQFQYIKRLAAGGGPPQRFLPLVDFKGFFRGSA